MYAKPNFPVLGKRLGKRMKEFGARIQQLTREQIESLQETGAITIDGETFGADEIQVLREAKPGTNALSNRFISIDLDCTLDDELIAEGVAREVVNRIQRSRKEMNLNVSDRITVSYRGAEAVRRRSRNLRITSRARRSRRVGSGRSGPRRVQRRRSTTRRSAIGSKWRVSSSRSRKQKGRYCGLNCADLSARSLSISPSS